MGIYQKGISSVVITIILLAIIMGLAGATYTFIRSFVQSRAKHGFEILHTEANEVVVRNLGEDAINEFTAKISGMDQDIAVTPLIAGDMVAHWSMNEAPPSTDVEDTSNYDNDGTLEGDGDERVGGHFGYGLDLDGGAVPYDYVRIPHHLSLKPIDEISIEAWVNIAALDGQSRWVVRTGWSNAPYFFGKNANDRIVLVINDEAALWNSNTAPIAQTGWHHIIGTYDGQTVRIYIDGVDSGWSYSFGAPTQVNTNSLSVFIGGGDSNGDDIADSQMWNGGIDEVRIYSRALTASEVSALYYGLATPGNTAKITVLESLALGRHPITICSETTCRVGYLTITIGE